MRRAISLLVLSFAAAAAAGPSHARVGEAAPPFKLDSVQGDEVSLEALRGKWVVVQFAATWCPITNQKIPHVETLAKDFKDRNVVVLAVDVMEKKRKIKKWVKKHGLTLPVLRDEDGTVARAYAPAKVPAGVAPEDSIVSATVLIDPRGTIRHYQPYSPETHDPKLGALRAKLGEFLRD